MAMFRLIMINGIPGWRIHFDDSERRRGAVSVLLYVTLTTNASQRSHVNRDLTEGNCNY